MILLPTPRWFADYRPSCIIENEYKEKLGARTDAEYSKLLQAKGLPLVGMKLNAVPNITLTGTSRGDTLTMKVCQNCNEKTRA